MDKETGYPAGTGPLIASCIAVFSGTVIQRMVDRPQADAWGPFEQIGWAIAALIWLGYAVKRLLELLT